MERLLLGKEGITSTRAIGKRVLNLFVTARGVILHHESRMRPKEDTTNVGLKIGETNTRLQNKRTLKEEI